MPINLCLLHASIFLIACRVGCSRDGESTKSGSSESARVPFPPCYKSHSYGITCSERRISTYLHTTFLTFSSGVKFQDYLREKILSFIWQRRITGWPWPPSAPLQYNFSVVISAHLSLSYRSSSRTSITSSRPSSHISPLLPPSHLSVCSIHPISPAPCPYI